MDNDVFECEMTRVPLSSVAVPFDEIGAKAMDLMLTLLRGEPPPSEPILIGPAHVETRLSSDPLIFKDELVTRTVRLISQPRPDPLKVAQLADELGVCRKIGIQNFRRFGKLFQKRFGKTPRSFQKER
ncbi:MAG: substrate-binding domain-containing protein [Kiritimatiellae bacterium]|nr:substrate-binding domain-containing protein [Kiritimatiellia bacterium]